MYQIDNSTAAQAIPASTAAGSKGYFTDGNPATGTPATIMPAEFMNMLMMENLNVLIAGGIVPDKTKFNQLALAISNIITAGVDSKVSGDFVTAVGFQADDVGQPYFRRKSDGKIYQLQPKLGFVPVQQGGGIGQSANPIKIGWATTGLKLTVDSADLGTFWLSSNFDPNLKADWGTTLAAYRINDAYTKTETEARLLLRPSSDGITTVGFADNNPSLPYMRRSSDGANYFLQPSLGFTPIQQGGGIGQLNNQLKIGWSAAGLKLTVDAVDVGNFWLSTNFNPDSKINSDSCPIAGFAGGDASVPYMKHTNGTVVALATKSYVDGRLVQATEATAGVAKIATSAQLNAGIDDASMLTSKKIRLGFYASLTTNGYIVFPQWLGSFIIQWGRYSLAAPAGSSVAITFPIPFGSTFPPMPWVGVDGGATDQIGTQGVTTTRMTVSKGSADISARTGSWFAFGGAF